MYNKDLSRRSFLSRLSAINGNDEIVKSAGMEKEAWLPLIPVAAKGIGWGLAALGAYFGAKDTYKGVKKIYDTGGKEGYGDTLWGASGFIPGWGVGKRGLTLANQGRRSYQAAKATGQGVKDSLRTAKATMSTAANTAGSGGKRLFGLGPNQTYNEALKRGVFWSGMPVANNLLLPGIMPGMSVPEGEQSPWEGATSLLPEWLGGPGSGGDGGGGGTGGGDAEVPDPEGTPWYKNPLVVGGGTLAALAAGAALWPKNAKPPPRHVLEERRKNRKEREMAERAGKLPEEVKEKT